MAEGSGVGAPLLKVGERVGTGVGLAKVGVIDGAKLGLLEGTKDGLAEGAKVGLIEGLKVGTNDGA